MRQAVVNWVCLNSGEYWTSADIVDCIVSYTVTQLMDIMTDANSREGVEMLAKVCIPEACMHTQQTPCHLPQNISTAVSWCLVFNDLAYISCTYVRRQHSRQEFRSTIPVL